MHKPALSVSSNVPVAHSCGVTLRTTQYEPVGHGAQSAAAVLPVAPENLPASHSVGATDRRADASGRAGFARLLALVALEPAAQAEHSSVPASRASLPAPHDVGYVAPSEQELPAVQLSHPSRLRPVKSPKMPAAHGFATVEPASQ